MGLVQALCLTLLPGLAQAQAYMPCPAGTTFMTVASSDDAATLTRSLQCSNGTFIVTWFGDVVVAQTLNITQGTSLNITGASTGATADGNHTTQLFAVGGASALHLNDMVLTNGNADVGGAVHAMSQARVSFDGNVTFEANTALYGGAIYADSSTVFWDGEETAFSSNYALHNGGSIMAEGSSGISWDGKTVFINNSANSAGGAAFLHESSIMSWSGETRFTVNTAERAGAIYADSSFVKWSGKDTTFSSNSASNYGGAIMATGSSTVAWGGVTVVMDSSGYHREGVVFVGDSSEMASSGKTMFTANAASAGGAIYAESCTVNWTGEGTTFSRNNASQHGGAIMTGSLSSLSWDGETVFISNTVGGAGGAVCAIDVSNVCWQGNTTFVNNSANSGGAVMAETSSVVSWDGETAFIGNTASYSGGAVNVLNESNASWKGNTTFTNNVASEGGAVVSKASCEVSWDGDTVFTDNRATYKGGGMLVDDYSGAYWTGSTIFSNNFAQDGGGLFIHHYSVGNWRGNTTFEGNTVVGYGGGLNVHMFSNISWAGVTTFASNVANSGGAVLICNANLAWTGITLFADNIAHVHAGAVFATLTHGIFCQGKTTFRNNTAVTGNGGAVSLFGSLSSEVLHVNISGGTIFTNNSAFWGGGAIYSTANSGGQHFQDVEFLLNSAHIGGAVAMFTTGNGDLVTPSPALFLRCRFIANKATMAGGAMTTASGQETIVSSVFESNSAGAGGALRLTGVTTVRDCSFVSNTAYDKALAVLAVGSVEIYGSSFHKNVFLCGEGQYLKKNPEDGLGTARYCRVCGGCPPREDCHNCTVDDSNLDATCSMALEHTTATGPDSTLETLSIDEGYWRATTTSSDILPCFNKAACLGGQTGSATVCDDGYMGPYCSVCQRGYSPSLATTCTRCSRSKRQAVVAIAIILAVVAFFAVAAFTSYLVSTNFDERSGTSVIQHRVLQVVPLHSFKSIIVVWQIVTQFASVANVTYPDIYRVFLSGIDAINLDLGFMLSTGCLWSDMDFHDRFLADTIGPLAILAFLGVTYAVALHRNAESGKMVREKIRNKHLAAMLLLMFLVYSSASSAVFRMFACDPLDDGKSYLRADYRIICTEAKHRALQVLAAIMVFVYPVGIPLLYAVLLYRHRQVLSDPNSNKWTAKPIADLWKPYKPRVFYYEVLECFRRIVLTGVVVFIYPNDAAQIAITLVNTFFFFLVSEVLSPYKSVSDMWLSRGGHLIIYFSMFDALLLKVDVSEESSESQHALAWVLVAGHVVMVVTIVVETIALYYAAREEGRVVEKDVASQNPIRKRSGELMFL